MKLPNLEPARQGKHPDFLVPASTVNLTKGDLQRQQASDGHAHLVTDGDKAGDEDSWVELGTNKQ